MTPHPDVFHQLFVTEDAVGIFCEATQKVELDAREEKPFRVEPYGKPSSIDLERPQPNSIAIDAQ